MALFLQQFAQGLLGAAPLTVAPGAFPVAGVRPRNDTAIVRADSASRRLDFFTFFICRENGSTPIQHDSVVDKTQARDPRDPDPNRALIFFRHIHLKLHSLPHAFEQPFIHLACTS